MSTISSPWLAFGCVFALGCGGCGRAAAVDEAGAPAGSALVASPAAAETAKDASADSSAGDAGGQSLPGRTDGCPEGMLRVEGEYCPAVIEDCEEEHDEYKTRGTRTVSERCLKYKQPTKCLSKQRVHMAFCMDRYEYPNKPGELPRVLTSWRQAVDFCAADNKRLCNEDEFNFACEGEEMRPYVWGFVRGETTCNIDKDYRYPDHSKVMLHYDECLKDAWCSAEMARLDQREKIAERTSCVSWAGVYDLNGNVNEWVNLPGQKPPNRSGLKGGWWGPVRDRCRPTVTFHKEEDYGYEQGFRCCADAK